MRFDLIPLSVHKCLTLYLGRLTGVITLNAFLYEFGCVYLELHDAHFIFKCFSEERDVLRDHITEEVLIYYLIYIPDSIEEQDLVNRSILILEY